MSPTQAYPQRRGEPAREQWGTSAAGTGLSLHDDGTTAESTSGSQWRGEERAEHTAEELGAMAQRPRPVSWQQRLFIDTLRGMLRHKVLCVVIVGLSGAVGAGQTMMMPPFYVATSSIYPRAAENPIGGFGLAGVAGLLGSLSTSGTGGSQFHLYENALYSRDLLTKLLQFRLDAAGFNVSVQDYLQIDEPDPELKAFVEVEALRAKLVYETDPDKPIAHIKCTDLDPRVAAAIANQAVALLNEFDLATSSSLARAKREFVEERLVSAMKDLHGAESRLEVFRAENMRIGNAPDLLLELTRLQRELEIEQQVYLTLRKEAELARVEEQKTVPMINILESAMAPVLPAGPSVLRKAAFTTLMGAFFLTAFFVVRAARPRQLLHDLGLLTH